MAHYLSDIGFVHSDLIGNPGGVAFVKESNIIPNLNLSRRLWLVVKVIPQGIFINNKPIKSVGEECVADGSLLCSLPVWYG